jgi:hypothetical protein
MNGRSNTAVFLLKLLRIAVPLITADAPEPS